MPVSYVLGLPIPTVVGYSNQDGQRLRQDDFNHGYYDFELLSEHVGAEFKVRWFFTPKFYRVFEGFHYHDLDSGSKAFTMQVKVGAGLVSHEFYFKNEYKAVKIGKQWQVTADLIAVSKNYDDLATYEAAKVSIIEPAADGDYHWPMDEASGNLSSVTGTAVLTLESTTPDYEQPSLRKDGSGNSIRYPASGNSGHHRNTAITIPWADGFTIECIVIPTTARNDGDPDGAVCAAVQSASNSTDLTTFVMRFDNFDDATDNDTYPVFSLIQRGNLYSTAADYGDVEAEVRSATATVLTNTYHLLATVRPSDNTIEFWVNGVSQGTATIPNGAAWFNPDTEGNNLLTGGQVTQIDVGNCYFNLTWQTGLNSTLQDVKIHLLEADDDFAIRQSNAANYTT